LTDPMSDETGLLAEVLATAPARLRAVAAPIVSKGALNIKTDWRTATSGLRHAPAFPASITYDLTAGLDQISAEIGPDKELPQGPLGNLLEYGSSKNPPMLAGAQALAAEEPKFYAALEAVIGDTVWP
jgi:hypothetical protein